MDNVIGRVFSKRWGIVSVGINGLVLLAAYVTPGILGGYRPEEIGSSHLAGLVVAINYPVFFAFDRLHSGKDWVAAPLEVFLLIACLIFYWYYEGILLKTLVNTIVRRRNTS